MTAVADPSDATLAGRLLRHRKMALGAGVVLVIVGVAAFASPAPARTAPFIPTSPDQVLEHLPERVGGPAAPSDQPIRDPELAERLARDDIRRYQTTSDPRYLGHAEARLSVFWDVVDAPVPLLVLRAKIRASNHDFGRALEDLNRALERQPAEPQALLERASIQAVIGRYEGAREDCRALAPQVSELVALGCSAVIRGATGDARAAASELQAAVARAPSLSDTDASYAYSLIGELLIRAGDAREGERALRRALAHAPNDAYTLGLLADLLLDTNRAVEVVPLLSKFERVDGLLLRLAIAERRLELPLAGKHSEELAERFAEARLRGSAVHRREEARYELNLTDDAARALQLALENFGVQREPWDLRLVLEAALAAKEPDKSRAARAFARQSKIQDPNIAQLLRALEEAR